MVTLNNLKRLYFEVYSLNKLSPDYEQYVNVIYFFVYVQARRTKGWNYKYIL